jgi:hypothetical protein
LPANVAVWLWQFGQSIRKFLDAVIVPNAVDVIDLDGNRLPAPFAESARVAAVKQLSGHEQTTLYGTAATALFQDELERRLAGPRN